MNMKTKVPLRFTLTRSIIFILVPLLISLLMYARMIVVLRDYMEYQVSNQAATLGKLVSAKFSSQLDELERVAGYFRDEKVAEDRMGHSAERLLDDNKISCGILKLGGIPVSGDELPPSQYPAVMKAFRGKSTVQHRDKDEFLFVSPIYNGDNIKYALYKIINADGLFQPFGISFYQGQGRFILTDATQQLQIPLSDDTDSSYFLQDNVQNALASLQKELGSNTSAATYCISGDSKDFLFMSEIEHGNFYLLGRISYDVVAESISSLSSMTLLVFLLLLALLFIGTFNMFSASARARESDELREAKRIAEEASKGKSNFIANMSHELRTPINVILGMDEMILRENTDEDTWERAMDIKGAAQILLGLINDVLDYSKIESGNLNIIPVEYDFVALIHDLVLLSENRAGQKSLNFVVEVQPDLPVGLWGDDIHIRQVMINLLTNAIKYTPQGSVTLKISGKRTGGDSILLHFEVIDTGIGIKPEDLKRLFVPYSRVEERQNRNVEGTGLGLSIIINLLRLMDSDLKVDSVYGEGSNFYFDLEQKIIDNEPIGDIRDRITNITKDYKYRPSFTAPKARVLMVDDNSMNRRLFVSLLKQTQIQITTVSSGQKCLELVQKEHFDLIFMDYLMPEMDGTETLHRLRELPDNLCQGVPVIALTANAFSGAAEKYSEMGFDGFLPKPIVTEDLEAMLVRSLPDEYLTLAPAKGSPGPAAVPGSSDSGATATDVSATETKARKNLPEIEGVNWEYAKLHIKDSDILMEMLREFHKNIDREYRDISDLARDIGTPDGLTGYRIRVHALKSASAMVGILSVSEFAKFLESAAKNGEVDKIKAATPILLDELLEYKERLQPCAEPEIEKTPLEDDSQLLELLDMLRFSMDQMDIGGTDAVMRQIQSHLYPTGLQESIDRLDEKISALDFEGAQIEIEYITKSLQAT